MSDTVYPEASIETALQELENDIFNVSALAEGFADTATVMMDSLAEKGNTSSVLYLLSFTATKIRDMLHDTLDKSSDIRIRSRKNI